MKKGRPAESTMYRFPDSTRNGNETGAGGGGGGGGGDGGGGGGGGGLWFGAGEGGVLSSPPPHAVNSGAAEKRAAAKVNRLRCFFMASVSARTPNLQQCHGAHRREW